MLYIHEYYDLIITTWITDSVVNDAMEVELSYKSANNEHHFLLA